MEKKEINRITKKEKEQAAITVIKTLYSQKASMKDIEYLSGKKKEEIQTIINNLEKN